MPVTAAVASEQQRRRRQRSSSGGCHCLAAAWSAVDHHLTTPCRLPPPPPPHPPPPHTPPHPHTRHLCSLLGESRPDFRWLIIGPFKSGSRCVRSFPFKCFTSVQPQEACRRRFKGGWPRRWGAGVAWASSAALGAPISRCRKAAVPPAGPAGPSLLFKPLPARLPACPPACLPACLPARLPTLLPARLQLAQGPQLDLRLERGRAWQQEMGHVRGVM